jgi:Ax21 family sulfation-dependent quorum factor
MKRSLIALALLAALPVCAQAGELSYSYVEADYTQADAEVIDTDGYGLKGSFGFADNFYGFADYSRYHFDSSLSVEPMELGVGFHKGANGTDFIAEVSFIGMNSEILGDDYHNDAWRGSVGVRSALGEHVEVQAKAIYTTVENFDDTFGLHVGGQYKFNKTWGLTAGYTYNAFNFLDVDADTWNVGLRASF